MVKSASDTISPEETSVVKPAPQKQITPPTGSQAAIKPQVPVEDALVTVGDWSMSVDEFKERLLALKEVVPDYDIENKDARKLVLDELVRQQLLVQSAKEIGLDQDRDIRLAVTEFERTLIVREMARKLTESIEVTDKDVLNFYNDNMDKLTSPVEYRVREIVLNDKLKASEILTLLLKGESFLQTAKQHSVGKSADKGGDLGFLTREPFLEMGEEILKLKVGEVSSIFKGPEGYYIIKLEAKRGGEVVPFDEIKQDIKVRMLTEKQQTIIIDFIDTLREKTKVDLNEDLLN